MTRNTSTEWAPMLFVICVLAMLLCCCTAPQSPVNELPPIYMPRGPVCGIWATDHTAPAGGLLPERHQDGDATDTIGVAVHHIIAVHRDSWHRPTRYLVRSFSRHSGDSCQRWVPATAFPAWRYVHPYRGWMATARDFIPGTATVQWSIGDSLPVTCSYYPDSIGRRIRKWYGVPRASFSACF